MSREAWGDEGLLPQNWEETAMRQEFDVARAKFNKWIVDFKKEVVNDEIQVQIEKCEDALDELANMMEGSFD
jgi:hypothetical protein